MLNISLIEALIIYHPMPVSIFQQDHCQLIFFQLILTSDFGAVKDLSLAKLLLNIDSNMTSIRIFSSLFVLLNNIDK